MLFVSEQPLRGSDIILPGTLTAAHVRSEKCLTSENSTHTHYALETRNVAVCGGYFSEEKEGRSVKESSRDTTIPFELWTQALHSVVMQHFVYNIMQLLNSSIQTHL